MLKKLFYIIISTFGVVFMSINVIFANTIKVNDMNLLVDSVVVEVEWEDNDSVRDIFERVKNKPIVVNANRYGGFEQVGSLGQNIKSNNIQMTTEPGDIVLYNGSNIVVFFGSNSWSYTKLGKIKNKNLNELKQLLDKEDVTLTLISNEKNIMQSVNSLVNTENKMVNETLNFDIDNKRVKLNSGYFMPTSGLGTWALNGETAYNSVYNALRLGVRLIDTAQYYGNEEEVGKAIKKAIDDKIVKREDVFITTKVMPSNYKNAKESINESLLKLQVDYIDLFLIHQPGSNDEGVYKALEEGVKENKIRSIGISNYYTKEDFDKVMTYAKTTPSVIQNENHIYNQNNELKEYVAKYGVVIESWYPFGGRGHTAESFDNEVIKEIAKKHKKTPAQIILRWHLQSNYIAIPGSSNELHIKENNDIYDFTLSDEEMKKIININKNQRYENW